MARKCNQNMTYCQAGITIQTRTWLRRLSYAPEESAAFGDASDILGVRTFDVHLNGEAFWRNVPVAVWEYRLGGYQVLKKWLSYREQKVLGRRLRAEEVQHFADTARRIGAILVAQAREVGRGTR